MASRPSMCPNKAARIFTKFKISNDIYSELPSKQHKGGGLSTIEVLVPKKGETLEYKTLIDPPIIEKEIL